MLAFQRLVFRVVHRRWIPQGARVYGLPIVSFFAGSSVQVGRGLVLISSSYFSEPGVSHPVVLRTLSAEAVLKIGDNVGISGGGICCAESVTIGDNVMLGANVFIADTDFHPIDASGRRFSSTGIPTSPVTLDDNVFVGMNSTILKGVHIGKNSVIGAHSVVASDIPPDSIAAGIPARVIRRL